MMHHLQGCGNWCWQTENPELLLLLLLVFKSGRGWLGWTSAMERPPGRVILLLLKSSPASLRTDRLESSHGLCLGTLWPRHHTDLAPRMALNGWVVPQEPNNAIISVSCNFCPTTCSYVKNYFCYNVIHKCICNFSGSRSYHVRFHLTFFDISLLVTIFEWLPFSRTKDSLVFAPSSTWACPKRVCKTSVNWNYVR